MILPVRDVTASARVRKHHLMACEGYCLTHHLFYDYCSITAQRLKRSPGNDAVMTYRGHRVLHTLLRAKFSPVFTTGQVSSLLASKWY